MRPNSVIKECESCGKPYKVIKCRENKSRFCSSHCHGVFVLGNFNQDLIPRHSGPEHHNWKGGRQKHSEGYIVVKRNGIKIMEHRAIMEDFLGRKLLRSEHVHHKNHVRTDNRIDNLELIDIHEHGRIHGKEHGKGVASTTPTT